jgi:hypothetical protein
MNLKFLVIPLVAVLSSVAALKEGDCEGWYNGLISAPYQGYFRARVALLLPWWLGAW